MIERLSTKELLAKSLKELAQIKPIDKITIKDLRIIAVYQKELSTTISG